MPRTWTHHTLEDAEFETTRRDADGEVMYACCTIEYVSDGWYRAATRIDPAEYPEIEIRKIIGIFEALGDETPLDFTEDFSDKVQNEMIAACEADYETDRADEYDGPDGPEDF